MLSKMRNNRCIPPLVCMYKGEALANNGGPDCFEAEENTVCVEGP